MKIGHIKNGLRQGRFNSVLNELYGIGNTERQVNRYLAAIEGLQARFGLPDDTEAAVYSSPGRAEICGNHTDHQRGCVLAAAIDADFICAVAKGNNVELFSEDYGEINIDKNQVNEPETPNSLVLGIIDYFTKNGYAVGGLKGYILTDVRQGSGLSSSAAFANLIGTALNHEYNCGRVPPLEIAKGSRYAENLFFGKPCGLMDQAASAFGGFVYIDFGQDEPVVESIPFQPEVHGLTLCAVHTGGSHADLTEEYASITKEMGSVAAALGCNLLANCDETNFYANLPNLRQTLGDRAVLRAFHFFNETERVKKQAEMLKKGDLNNFLQLINESGKSSMLYLQNIYVINEPKSQCLSLALALAEHTLRGNGAYRVHGGGFAGTILAFVPNELYANFVATMDGVFGFDSCKKLAVRQIGATKVI